LIKSSREESSRLKKSEIRLERIAQALAKMV
jgi:hypothetical protein